MYAYIKICVCLEKVTSEGLTATKLTTKKLAEDIDSSVSYLITFSIHSIE